MVFDVFEGILVGERSDMLRIELLLEISYCNE